MCPPPPGRAAGRALVPGRRRAEGRTQTSTRSEASQPAPHTITALAPTWGPNGKKPTEQNYTFNLEKLGGPSQCLAPSPLPPSAGKHWLQERFIFNNAIYIPLST